MSSHGTSEIAHFGDEDAFRHSEQRYRALIEQSTDITVLVDAAGMVTYVSPSITPILGYAPEDFVGSHALAIVHPDDVETMQQVLGGILHTPGKSLHAEYRLHCKDGSWRWFESEARLRFMAESMPQKIFTAKPDGGIDYFNPQWTEFTGLSFEEIRDWRWTQLIHPDDVEENVRRWQHSIDTGELFYFEHRFRRADGVYRWHVSRAIPMRDAEGNITMWIGSNTDIDEQKQLEARKDAFISMASHELKTPVTSLVGFTHLLQRRLSSESDAQTRLFLERMDVQLTKLTKLISDLLDLSKIQTGRLTSQEELVDLDALVHDTVEQVQATTPTHHLHCVGHIYAQVSGDRDRLGQVFINLLSNAVKYSPGADTVLITLSKDGEHALVSIRDFGIGIAEAHHERIFERFYQVPDPLEKTFPGLGIGLYLSREMILRHQGRLWVESRRGQGSTFHVSLPVQQWQQEELRERA